MIQPVLPTIAGPASVTHHPINHPSNIWQQNRAYKMARVSLENKHHPYKEVFQTDQTLLDYNFSQFVDLFLMESFVGFQTLLNYFYAREHLGNIEVTELLEAFYQACDDAQRAQKEPVPESIKLLGNKWVRQFPLQGLDIGENAQHMIERFVHLCSKLAENDAKLHALLKADPPDGAHGEAAEFFGMFDKLKKRMAGMHVETVGVLPFPLVRLFDIPKALFTSPLYAKQGWHLISQNQHLNYLIQASLMDMLMYQWLLHDDLPFGVLTFYFAMNHNKNTGDNMLFEAVVCQDNQVVKRVDVRFDVKNKSCVLVEKSSIIGKLNVIFSKKNHVEIKGKYKGEPFKLAFSSEHDGRFNEHIQVTDWTSDFLGSRGAVKEFGWRSHKTGEQKKLRSRYAVYKNRYNDLLTHQDCCLGEDRYSISTWFHQYLFIPLAATGIIFNEKRHKYTL